MFPNPQDALPLPARPSLEHYKKIAKELVKASKSGEIGDWAERWMDGLADEVEEFARRKLSGERKCVLADAQFAIARSHGFESWPKFSQHLAALAKSSPVSRCLYRDPGSAGCRRGEDPRSPCAGECVYR